MNPKDDLELVEESEKIHRIFTQNNTDINLYDFQKIIKRLQLHQNANVLYETTSKWLFRKLLKECDVCLKKTISEFSIFYKNYYFDVLLVRTNANKLKVARFITNSLSQLSQQLKNISNLLEESHKIAKFTKITQTKENFLFCLTEMALSNIKSESFSKILVYHLDTSIEAKENSVDGGESKYQKEILASFGKICVIFILWGLEDYFKRTLFNVCTKRLDRFTTNLVEQKTSNLVENIDFFIQNVLIPLWVSVLTEDNISITESKLRKSAFRTASRLFFKNLPRIVISFEVHNEDFEDLKTIFASINPEKTLNSVDYNPLDLRRFLGQINELEFLLNLYITLVSVFEHLVPYSVFLVPLCMELRSVIKRRGKDAVCEALFNLLEENSPVLLSVEAELFNRKHQGAKKAPKGPLPCGFKPIIDEEISALNKDKDDTKTGRISISRDSFDSGECTDDDTESWQPDFVSESGRFKESVIGRHYADKIYLIVDLCDTAKDFLSALRVHFTTTLLSFRRKKLKKRYLKSTMVKLFRNVCSRVSDKMVREIEVILADVEHSERLNKALSSVKENRESKENRTNLFPVETLLVSSEFWSQTFDKGEIDDVRLPGIVKSSFDLYEDLFKNNKKARYLIWKLEYGFAEIEISLAGVVVTIMTTSLNTLVLALFIDDIQENSPGKEWNLFAIAMRLNLPKILVEKSLKFWLGLGILCEVKRNLLLRTPTKKTKKVKLDKPSSEEERQKPVAENLFYKLISRRSEEILALERINRI